MPQKQTGTVEKTRESEPEVTKMTTEGVSNVSPTRSEPLRREKVSNTTTTDGKPVLKEEDCYEATAYSFSNRYKWTILAIVAVVQTSMNYNAAVYSNAVGRLNGEFHINRARHGMTAFLVTYAFGCELWAPWSEEFGRWPIMQASLGLVNLWQLPCIFAPNWNTVLVGRILGGLSSAGGSVTLGMVADMWEPDEQQHAVAFVALWSCLGSVIGGVAGGPIEQYLPWKWNFIIQLVFGIVVQLLHGLLVPETRATVRLAQEAKKRRKEGKEEVYGEMELRPYSERFHWREISKIMLRPYHMLLTEPIVLFLSLLSGFSDALIFSFLESFGYVFNQWGFDKLALGIALLPLLVGYVLAYFSFLPVIEKHSRIRRKKGSHALSPEKRLWWLLFLVPLLPLGLLGFAFVSTGPPLPWIAALLFSCLIGMANFAIYFATIDYMVAAYGEFSASATGGNGFMRDFLAGMCSLYTKPLYKNLKPKNASFLLAGVAVLVTMPVHVFYWFGPQIRARSKFAQELAEKHDRKMEKVEAKRAAYLPQEPSMNRDV